MPKRLIITVALMLFMFFTQSVVFASDTSPPTNLSVSEVTDGQATLQWEKSVAEDTVDVWKSKNGKSWERVVRATSLTTSSVDNLETNVNYYFVATTPFGGQDPRVIDLEEIKMDGDNINASNIAVTFSSHKPAHESYKRNTNVCSNCHRTHTGEGPQLLKHKTVTDTCTTCHDGSGSKYNIFSAAIDGGNGEFLDSNAGPFGDFFRSYVRPDRTYDTEFPVKSIHSFYDYSKPKVDDKYQAVNISSAPGYNDHGDGMGDKAFNCASCHNVHPIDNFYNYRMLRNVLPGTPMNPDGTVEEENLIRVIAFAETDKAGKREKIYYRSGMNDFCLGCHTDYRQGEEGIDNYKHKVGIDLLSLGSESVDLPLEGKNYLGIASKGYDSKNGIICLTCHNSHGSNSLTLVQDDKYKDGNNTDRNFLLKKDYRGVCQDCHQK